MLVRYVKHYGVSDALTLEAESVAQLKQMMDEWKKLMTPAKKGSAEWFAEKEAKKDEQP